MQRVFAAIRKAHYPVVFTGAGISKDSGIQTFRDSDGLWKDFDLQKYATYEGFCEQPEKVWQWYLWRMDKIQAAGPNLAHHFVAELERRTPALQVITQNIDGLHQKARSRNVIELHGNISRVKCCSCSRVLDAAEVDFSVLPPRCTCGDMLRPDVVWFGEALSRDILMRAFAAASKADLAIVIGTSCLVYPAAEIPFIVKRQGGTVIEINPEETPLSPHADVRIHKPTQEFYQDCIEEITG